MFLLDGVDIGDNLFARPDDLFVEEAIEETQVLTSAVSAEYGRFSGGVVNAVTKRGGNLFSGSVRSNLSNAAWTDETPFEKAAGQQRQNKMDRYYEGTLGGPLREDRVWFFFAGRSQSSDTSLTLAQTAAAFQQTDDQHRWDLKLTATPMSNQTVQVQYLDRRQKRFAPSLPITIDPTAGDHTDTPGQPVRRPTGTACSPIASSRPRSTRSKTNHPRFGNTSTRLQDSPFLTIGRVSPGGLHFGAALLRSHRSRGSRQQPADRQRLVFRIASGLRHARRQGRRRSVLAGAARRQLAVVHRLPLQHRLRERRGPSADRRDRPRRAGVDSRARRPIGNTLPTRGAEIDITTTSFYVQDRWTPTARLTLDLGLRYEHVVERSHRRRAEHQTRSRLCRASARRISCAKTAARSSARRTRTTPAATPRASSAATRRWPMRAA